MAIIGDNEPEWFWAAFATQAGKGIVVPQFTDAIPEELKYTIDFADCKFVVARDQEQVDKILDIKEHLPKVQKVIYWYYKGMRSYTEPFLARFDQVEEMGRTMKRSIRGSSRKWLIRFLLTISPISTTRRAQPAYPRR